MAHAQAVAEWVLITADRLMLLTVMLLCKTLWLLQSSIDIYVVKGAFNGWAGAPSIPICIQEL